MTDKEWIETLPTASNKELIESLDYFGYDSYYRTCREPLVAEITKRLNQLTKAKELLKEFNLVLKERGLYHNGLYKRTEQFLNSEVEK